MKMKLHLASTNLGDATVEALGKLHAQEAKSMTARMKRAVRDGGAKLHKHLNNNPMVEIYKAAGALNPWGDLREQVDCLVLQLPGVVENEQLLDDLAEFKASPPPLPPGWHPPLSYSDPTHLIVNVLDFFYCTLVSPDVHAFWTKKPGKNVFFYFYILSCLRESKLPALTPIALDCLWTPVSSADIERSFGCYKRVL